MSTPAVSVLIAQWGETDLTARAVDAVFRSDYGGRIDVLVYDNASPGGPGRVANMASVDLVLGDANVGFGPAINHLARRASGEVLLILNNDTIVDPRCLRLLVERMQGADRPFAVGPQYRDFGGDTLEMGGYLGSDASGWQLFRNALPPHSLERLSYPAHYSSAACLLIDAELFLDAGGFDDAFAPAYYEDTDVCLRMAAQGRRTVIEPRAIVFHYEGGTAGTDVTQGFKTFQVLHRTTFAERHREWLEHQPLVSLGAALTHALEPPRRHRVLWMAPTLPRPDQAGGEARIMKMIEALQAAGDMVAVWGEHSHDAGRYGRLLEEQGIPWFGREPQGRGAAAADRMMSSASELLADVPWDAAVVSFPELAERITPVARELRPEMPVLVDSPDLHYLRRERAGDADSAARDWELGVYRMTDGVIAASEPEAELIADALLGMPVFGFPVTAEQPRPITSSPDGSVLFLGSFHHHPNVDAVQFWADDIAARLRRLAGRSAPLRVIGANTDAYREEWPPDDVEVVGWVDDLTEEFARAAVFAAPLRYGAGTKGKITAALAFGRPIVTTSIGAEGFGAEVLDALIVTDDAEEFAEAVARLLNDEKAWAEQAARTRKAADGAWLAYQTTELAFADWVGRRARFRSVSA